MADGLNCGQLGFTDNKEPSANWTLVPGGVFAHSVLREARASRQASQPQLEIPIRHPQQASLSVIHVLGVSKGNKLGQIHSSFMLMELSAAGGT